MDELLSRAQDPHGGLGNCAGLSGLTAQIPLAFAEVSGPDDLSRRLQAAFSEYRGSSLLSSRTTSSTRASHERSKGLPHLAVIRHSGATARPQSCRRRTNRDAEGMAVIREPRAVVG
jgi:hypothetical protein